jgi:hypothetical protein
VKATLAVTLALFVTVTKLAAAHANVDGSVPSTGSCDYPSVGTFGAAFGEYDYGCQFPLEINGTRHTTLFGGGMWQVTAGVSFNIFVVGVNAGVIAPAGVLRGISYWACPDLSMGEQPNPPGAWKNEIHPGKCKTLAPPPVLMREQPEPPPGAPHLPRDAAQGVNGQGPAVTDPGQGNPDATVNDPK